MEYLNNCCQCCDRMDVNVTYSTSPLCPNHGRGEHTADCMAARSLSDG